MSDSSWQQAVLREIGVPQRGFQVLEEAPAPSQGAWGAEAPPRPAPGQPPAAPSVAPPVVEAVPHAPEEEAAAPAQPLPSPPQPPSHGVAEPSLPAPPPPPTPAPSIPPPPTPPPAPPMVPVAPAAAEVEEEIPAPPAPVFPSPHGDGPELPPPPAPPAPLPIPEPPSIEQPAAEPWQPAEPPRPVEPWQPAESPPAEPWQPAEPQPPEQQQPAEPLMHPDFDWAAAVSPMPGVSSTEAPDARDGAAPTAGHAPPVPPRPAQPVQPQPPGPGPQQPPSQIPASDLVRRNQHGDPLGRRVRQNVRRVVGGGSGAEREMAAFAELMRHSVPGARQIAVASVRGGAGKTTMAALVATELARHRADRVLAADADAELGSLPLRLGVRSQLSLFDLAGQNPRTFEEAAQFLSRTPDGLFVLSSTRDGRIAGEFTLETFQSALNAVGRYVAATVVDCGAGILTELNRGVIAGSHGLVLVTPGTVDGALSARGALEWFAGNNQQGLLPRTVIAMVSHAPQVGADLERAHQMLTAWGLPVVSVPYDRHLATGGSLDMSKISAAARAAVIRVVHEVFSRSLSAGMS
ncbi:AAA family ATPase [Actinomadura terrae]|uniref:AAA family ATPase n=1 Tax=Actinomadura terrae TaxID=604353 RepID=UPI0027DF3D64|nr:MinD/ParA family protein [Actinomadura terrae]